MSFALADSEPSTVLLLTDACQLFGRARVRWALRCGRWQRPHPKVVVTHSAALSVPEALLLAALAGPPGSLLGGLTAAGLDGLRGVDEDDVHLVVPHSARVGTLPSGVVVHRSLVLESDQARPAASPPRTRLERSVIDAASWSRWPRRSRAIVLAVVQQRLTTAVGCASRSRCAARSRAADWSGRPSWTQRAGSTRRQSTTSPGSSCAEGCPAVTAGGGPPAHRPVLPGRPVRPVGGGRRGRLSAAAGRVAERGGRRPAKRGGHLGPGAAEVLVLPGAPRARPSRRRAMAGTAGRRLAPLTSTSLVVAGSRVAMAALKPATRGK